jgi:hypothetical protein
MWNNLLYTLCFLFECGFSFCYGQQKIKKDTFNSNEYIFDYFLTAPAVKLIPDRYVFMEQVAKLPANIFFKMDVDTNGQAIRIQYVPHVFDNIPDTSIFKKYIYQMVFEPAVLSGKNLFLFKNYFLSFSLISKSLSGNKWTGKYELWHYHKAPVVCDSLEALMVSNHFIQYNALNLSSFNNFIYERPRHYIIKYLLKDTTRSGGGAEVKINKKRCEISHWKRYQ